MVVDDTHDYILAHSAELVHSSALLQQHKYFVRMILTIFRLFYVIGFWKDTCLWASSIAENT